MRLQSVLMRILQLKVFIALLLILAGHGLLAGPVQLPLGSHGTVSLQGTEWEFFESKTYADLISNPTLTGKRVSVPDNWTEDKAGTTGYHTYRFVFGHDLRSDADLGLYLTGIGTACKVYVNGVQYASAGTFGQDAATSHPDFQPLLIRVPHPGERVELVIEVSNFHYRNGGIWYPPIAGEFYSVSKNVKRQLFNETFLFGALIVLFIYFLAFYYIKTEDKTSLLFAVMCLFAALRMASTGNLLIRHLELPISWHVMVRTEFISLAMMLGTGLLYMRALFPKDVNSKVLFGQLVLHGIFVLAALFLPVKYSSALVPYYLLVCGFLVAYVLNLLIKVLREKRPFAVHMAVALVFASFCGVNDILYSQGIGFGVYLLPLGILVFSLIQAVVLTQKFSAAFHEVELLTEKLRTINQNQKEVIQERTSLLNMQAQELQQSNQIKDKVFSIIAHDLRAPIKSLSTVLSWVAEDDLTLEELKKSLSSISRNVDTLNLTLENLLQWSRNQLNGLKNEPEMIDLRKPIQDIIDLYKIQLNEKRLHVANDLHDRHAVFMDKHHLTLLLRNLISNAIKFSHPGGTIEIKASSELNGNCVVSIHDHGVGMTEEIKQKVFSQTEHVTTYGTSNEKGTGLGLLLCKEYVDNCKGEIWIESEPEKGTTVYFRVPAEAW